MSVELTGGQNEEFETRPTPNGFELIGEGRLARWTVNWPEPWRTLGRADDAVGADFEHPVGAWGRVRVRSGRRLRMEVTVESRGEVVVPGPTMGVGTASTPIAWLGGASGEVVLTSETGPGLLTQRRGDSVPTSPCRWHLLQEEIRLWPGRVVSASWTYESMEGDAWTIPPEPPWLPVERYVPAGHPVTITAPDGRVESECQVREGDGGFDVFPNVGVHRAEVWSAAGPSRIDIGGYLSLEELRERALRDRVASPESVYVAVRHMMASWIDDDLLDWVERHIASLAEEPSPWLAGAAQLGVSLGLPTARMAKEIATAVLERPTKDGVIILAMHGLATADLGAGAWPVGNLRSIGQEAFSRMGHGRIRNCGPATTGRDIALGRLFLAGLGENERALRLSACAQAATNELMCRLSANPNHVDLAWLSLQE